MTARPPIVQINLAPTLGGAEVFTAFMSRALVARGWPTRVIVGADAHVLARSRFRRRGTGPRARRNRRRERAGTRRHRAHPRLAARARADGLRERGAVLGIAHQAIYDASRPAYYGRADLMFGVSRHVIATLRDNGVANVHAEPLLGIGEIHRLHTEAAPRPRCRCANGTNASSSRGFLPTGQRIVPGAGNGRTYAKTAGAHAGHRVAHRARQAVSGAVRHPRADHRGAAARQRRDLRHRGRLQAAGANCAARCARSGRASASGVISATWRPPIAASTTC